MIILEAKNLLKQYGNGEVKILALKHVNFSIEKGEFVSIIGASGSGKSTFLHIIGGLDKPTEGSVIMDGINMLELDTNELTIFRRRNIGFVFQSFNLVPVCNVYENIVLPITLDGKEIDEKYVDDIINTLGLTEKRYNYPNQLSGGQQQRVAIARSLATKPKLILADEPTGNLDSKTSEEVIQLLKKSSDKYNQTVIMITHNEELAQKSDRIVRMEDGQLILGGEGNE